METMYHANINKKARVTMLTSDKVKDWTIQPVKGTLHNDIKQSMN